MTLAKLCERAGVDLRIVVSMRDTDSIVSSTTKREFGDTPQHEIAVLTNNAAVMTAQLSMLDPLFLYCIDFNDLGGTQAAESWSEMSKFIHPILDPKTLQSSFMYNGRWQAAQKRREANQAHRKEAHSSTQTDLSSHPRTHHSFLGNSEASIRLGEMNQLLYRTCNSTHREFSV